MAEAVVEECFVKKVFLKISQSSQKTACLCVSGGKKCCFSENFPYVLNEWSLTRICLLISSESLNQEAIDSFLGLRQG